MSIRRFKNAIAGLKTENGEKNAIQKVLRQEGYSKLPQVTQGKAPDGRLIRLYVWRNTPSGHICMMSGPDIEAEVCELFPVEPGDELGTFYFPAKGKQPALSNVKNPLSLNVDRNANPGHVLTLYHRTTPEAAESIYKDGRFTSKIRTQFGNEIYFSNRIRGVGEDYGEGLVVAQIPEQYANLDDEFPDGEQHFWVSAQHLQRYGKLVRPNRGTRGPTGPVRFKFLDLSLIEDAIPFMEDQGVSEVARSSRGFVTAYRRAGGDPDRLARMTDSHTGQPWDARRNGFIARHMAQLKNGGWQNGAPTRQHLALVAWAYSPSPKRLQDWLRSQSRRTNGAPGYQSWSWTQEDWRSIKVSPDGKVDYGHKCGDHGTRTHAGHPRLCLPVDAIKSLMKSERGRDELRLQARRKARAGAGKRVPYLPLVAQAVAKVTSKSPPDDPKANPAKGPDKKEVGNYSRYEGMTGTPNYFGTIVASMSEFFDEKGYLSGVMSWAEAAAAMRYFLSNVTLPSGKKLSTYMKASVGKTYVNPVEIEFKPPKGSYSAQSTFDSISPTDKTFIDELFGFTLKVHGFSFAPEKTTANQTDTMTDYFDSPQWVVPGTTRPFLEAIIASTMKRNGKELNATGKEILAAVKTGSKKTGSKKTKPSSQKESWLAVFPSPTWKNHQAPPGGHVLPLMPNYAKDFGFIGAEGPEISIYTSALQGKAGVESAELVVVSGDTYDIKDTVIKPLGFKWSGKKQYKWTETFNVPPQSWWRLVYSDDVQAFVSKLTEKIAEAMPIDDDNGVIIYTNTQSNLSLIDKVAKKLAEVKLATPEYPDDPTPKPQIGIDEAEWHLYMLSYDMTADDVEQIEKNLVEKARSFGFEAAKKGISNDTAKDENYTAFWHYLARPIYGFLTNENLSDMNKAWFAGWMDAKAGVTPKPKVTPQVPAMAGMTPLGLELGENMPNVMQALATDVNANFSVRAEAIKAFADHAEMNAKAMQWIGEYPPIDPSLDGRKIALAVAAMNATPKQPNTSYPAFGAELGQQLGSNKGGVIEIPPVLGVTWSTGVKAYFKDMGPAFEGDNYTISVGTLRAINEVLANQIYRLMGLYAPDMQLVVWEPTPGNAKVGVASPWIEGYEKFLPSKATSKDKLRLSDSLAIDAWMANWDVVGLAYDNLLRRIKGYTHAFGQNPEGVHAHLRVDNGGALVYRAQGQPKNFFESPIVNEIYTLRTPDANAQAAKAFFHVEDSDFADGIEYLYNTVWKSTLEIIMEQAVDAGVLGFKGGLGSFQDQSYTFVDGVLKQLMQRLQYMHTWGNENDIFGAGNKLAEQTKIYKYVTEQELTPAAKTELIEAINESLGGNWVEYWEKDLQTGYTQEMKEQYASDLISIGEVDYFKLGVLATWLGYQAADTYPTWDTDPDFSELLADLKEIDPDLKKPDALNYLYQNWIFGKSLTDEDDPAVQEVLSDTSDGQYKAAFFAGKTAFYSMLNSTMPIGELISEAPIGTLVMVDVNGASALAEYTSWQSFWANTLKDDLAGTKTKNLYVKVSPKMWGNVMDALVVDENGTPIFELWDGPNTTSSKLTKLAIPQYPPQNVHFPQPWVLGTPYKPQLPKFDMLKWLEFITKAFPNSEVAEEGKDVAQIEESQPDLSTTPSQPVEIVAGLKSPVPHKELQKYAKTLISWSDLGTMTDGPNWPSMHSELKWSTYKGKPVLVGRPKTGNDGVLAWFYSLILYNKVGARAALPMLVVNGNDLWVALFGLEDYQPGTFEALDPFRPQLSAEFPADAWLANWPVFGPKANMYENVWVKNDGSDYMRAITFGTFTMKWTAKGKPYPPDTIGEMTTMLDTSLAPSAALLFSDVKDDPVIALPMATRITELNDPQIIATFEPGPKTGNEDLVYDEWQPNTVARAHTMGRDVVPTLLPKGLTGAFEGTTAQAKKKVKERSVPKKDKTQAAGALITDGKRILLVKRAKWMSTSPAQWTIPGGTIDPGESPRQAALREAKEELGHLPKGIRPAGIEITATYPPKKGSKKPFTFHTVVFSMPSKQARYYKPFLEDARTSYAEETDGWAWVDIDEVQIYDTPNGPRAIWIPKLHSGIADPLPFNLGGEEGSMLPLLELWKTSNDDWNAFAKQFKESALQGISAEKLMKEGLPFDYGTKGTKPKLKNPSGYVLSGVKTDQEGVEYVEYRPKMPDGSRPRLRVELPEVGLGLEQAATEYRLGRKFPEAKPSEASVLAAPLAAAIWKFGQGVLSSMGAVLTGLFGTDPTEKQLEGAALLEAAGLPITDATPQIKEVVKIVEKIVEKEVPVEVVKEIVAGGPTAAVAADQLGLPLVEVLGQVKLTKAQEATIEDLQDALKELLGDNPSPKSGTAAQKALKSTIQSAIVATKGPNVNSESKVGKYLRILVEAKKVGLWKDRIDPGRRVVYRGLSIGQLEGQKSFTLNARSQKQLEAMVNAGITWSGGDLAAVPKWLQAQSKGINGKGFVAADVIEETRSRKYLPIAHSKLVPPSQASSSKWQTRNNTQSIAPNSTPTWSDEPFANVEGFHVDYRNYSHKGETVSHWTSQWQMGFGSGSFAIRCRADLYEGFIMIPKKTLEKDSYQGEYEVICVDMGVDKPIPAQVVIFNIAGYNEKLTQAQNYAWMGARPPYPKGYTIPGNRTDIEKQPPYVRRQNTFAPKNGMLIGYRVMQYDPDTGTLISGADSRITLDPVVGETHTMRGKGMFLGSTPDYVMDYYANHDLNALLAYSFEPEHVTSGSLTDREPEITVSEAVLLGVRYFDEDGEPVDDQSTLMIPIRNSPWPWQKDKQKSLFSQGGDYIEAQTLADDPFPPPVGQRSWKPPAPPKLPVQRPHPEPGQPVMTWMVGIPAVGKSSWVISEYGSDPKAIVIDADLWKTYHPDYDPKNPMAVHRWSRDHVKQMFKEVVANPEEGETVIIDGTGTFPPDVIRDMNIARDAGYYIELVWVTAPLWLALLRNERRERRVPEEIICQKAGEVKRSFEKVAPYADMSMIVSTGEDEDIEFVPPVPGVEGALSNAEAWIEEVLAEEFGTEKREMEAVDISLPSSETDFTDDDPFYNDAFRQSLGEDYNTNDVIYHEQIIDEQMALPPSERDQSEIDENREMLEMLNGETQTLRERTKGGTVKLQREEDVVGVEPLRNGTQVQTLMFDRSVFSKSGARSWAGANGFAAPATDTYGGFHRLRQESPNAFRQGSFRTIDMTDGVKAVIGVPK